MANFKNNSYINCFKCLLGILFVEDIVEDCKIYKCILCNKNYYILDGHIYQGKYPHKNIYLPI